MDRNLSVDHLRVRKLPVKISLLVISYFLIVDCSLDQSIGEGQVYLDLLMMRGMKMMKMMMTRMMKMMIVKTQTKESFGGRKQ